MRGVYLQQQFEFRLSIEEESVRQGEQLNCKLVVKNHNDTEQPLKDLQLILALGDIKKVKQKERGAFTIVESAELPKDQVVSSGGEVEFEYQFKLDINAVISDKMQSLYILFGNSGNLDNLGQLPLTVNVHPDIEEVLTVFESALQFVVKSRKSNKGYVVIRIQPSSAAKFSMLEQLNLSARFEDGKLELKYVFDLKRFEATASSLGVSKTKSTVQQILDPAEYKRSGYVEHGVIEKHIQDAISQAV